MDGNIKPRGAVVLRNNLTGQVNHFDDQAAADNFLATVTGADEWAQEATEAPAGKLVAVDLAELRAALAAEHAAEDAAEAAAAPAGEAAPAETAPAPAAPAPRTRKTTPKA